MNPEQFRIESEERSVVQKVLTLINQEEEREYSNSNMNSSQASVRSKGNS